jgi:hypothetical protein
MNKNQFFTPSLNCITSYLCKKLIIFTVDTKIINIITINRIIMQKYTIVESTAFLCRDGIFKNVEDFVVGDILINAKICR